MADQTSTPPQTVPALRSLGASPSCVHHWLLSEPAAGVIPGRCKRCGGQRAFPATPEGIERFDDNRELMRPRLLVTDANEIQERVAS